MYTIYHGVVTSCWQLDLKDAFLYFPLLKFQFSRTSQFDDSVRDRLEEQAAQTAMGAPVVAFNYERILIFVNIVFTVLFTVECILKLIAFGVKVRDVNVFVILTRLVTYLSSLRLFQRLSSTVTEYAVLG